MNNIKNTTKTKVSLFNLLGKGFIKYGGYLLSGLIKIAKYTAKFILMMISKLIKAIDYLVVFIVKKIIYLFKLLANSSMAVWLKHNVAQLLKLLKLKLLQLYNAPYTKRLRKTAIAQLVRKIVVVSVLKIKKVWKAFWVALGFSLVRLKRSLVKRPQLRPAFISYCISSTSS